MSKEVAADNLRKMALTRQNTLRATQTPSNVPGVSEGTQQPKSTRRATLPPRPAGWGDDETVTRQSLLAAQSLKVGK